MVTSPVFPLPSTLPVFPLPGQGFAGPKLDWSIGTGQENDPVYVHEDAVHAIGLDGMWSDQYEGLSGDV